MKTSFLALVFGAALLLGSGCSDSAISVLTKDGATGKDVPVGSGGAGGIAGGPDAGVASPDTAADRDLAVLPDVSGAAGTGGRGGSGGALGPADAASTGGGTSRGGGGAGGSGTGGAAGTGGGGGTAAGGATGLDAGSPPPACSQLTTQDACDARGDCHSVFEDPGNCRCATSGCCARFESCAEGGQANCTGPALCELNTPNCESPYVVSYQGWCFEGCVKESECAGGGSGGDAGGPAAFDAPGAGGGPGGSSGPGGAGTGGGGGAGGGGGTATGGATGLDAGSPPPACSQLTTQDACDARGDCHSVFEDPGDCRCATSGCCARFESCAEGGQADCLGPALCELATPNCESPYVVSYRGSCYEGCVKESECAGGGSGGDAGGPAAFDAPGTGGGSGGSSGSGGAGTGGGVGAGGGGGTAAGGATGLAADALPTTCGQLTTQTECDQRSDCHSVFEDPGTCGCATPGCCARFKRCADGGQADCIGPALCELATPNCESPYVVSYQGSCFEGCVKQSECAPSSTAAFRSGYLLAPALGIAVSP